jgi:hypothetical protein
LARQLTQVPVQRAEPSVSQWAVQRVPAEHLPVQRVPAEQLPVQRVLALS